MEIIINAFLIHSLDDIEKFQIKVTEEKYKIVKKKLEEQKEKSVDILKKLKKDGKIRSIFKPIDRTLIKPRKINGKDFSFRTIKTNTKLQDKIDNLVKTKNEINKSLEKLKEFYK